MLLHTTAAAAAAATATTYFRCYYCADLRDIRERWFHTRAADIIAFLAEAIIIMSFTNCKKKKKKKN